MQTSLLHYGTKSEAKREEGGKLIRDCQNITIKVKRMKEYIAPKPLTDLYLTRILSNKNSGVLLWSILVACVVILRHEVVVNVIIIPYSN